MCKYAKQIIHNGLGLKCINGYDILNSPCAAQPPELCCPNSSKGLARNSFSMTEEGEAQSMLHCNLLSAHIYPPDNSWTLTEAEGEGEIFHLNWQAAADLISAASYRSNAPFRLPCPPQNTCTECVFTNTSFIYMSVKHSHADSM